MLLDLCAVLNGIVRLLTISPKLGGASIHLSGSGQERANGARSPSGGSLAASTGFKGDVPTSLRIGSAGYMLHILHSFLVPGPSCTEDQESEKRNKRRGDTR